MFKWVLRIIYIFVILFLTRAVIGVTNVVRNRDYYIDQVQDLANEADRPENAYIDGLFNFLSISAASQEAYFDPTPVLVITSDLDNIQFTYKVYSVYYKNSAGDNYGYLSTIEDLSVTLSDGTITQTPSIKQLYILHNLDGTVTNDFLQINDLANTRLPYSFLEIKKESADSAPKFLLVDNNKDQHYLDVLTKIQYEYLDSDGTYKMLLEVNAPLDSELAYTYNEPFTYSGTAVEIQGNAFNFYLENSNAETFTNFDPTVVEPYKGGMTTFIIFYVLFVVMLTFFIFFRKPVFNYLRARKNKKLATEKTVKEIKEDKKTVEAIFNDEEKE